MSDDCPRRGATQAAHGEDSQAARDAIRRAACVRPAGDTSALGWTRMSAPDDHARSAHEPGAKLRRLLPAPGAATLVAEVLEGLDLRGAAAGAPPDRPYTLLNMVSTLDGRATLGGRSGPIGNRADRELFHGLRTAVDAVLVGAGTARTERYGRIVRDPAARASRREAGLAGEPYACIVSASLALPPDMPLLADPEARVVLLTPAQASLGPSAASVEYVRAGRDGQLDLPAALAELTARFGVRTLLCEGGPHLGAQLLAAGLLDELFLSLAPKLAGEDGEQPAALRILAGAAFEPPVELALRGLLEYDSHLFLRYVVAR